jgi:hypothetical protein
MTRTVVLCHQSHLTSASLIVVVSGSTKVKRSHNCERNRRISHDIIVAYSFISDGPPSSKRLATYRHMGKALDE